MYVVMFLLDSLNVWTADAEGLKCHRCRACIYIYIYIW